MTSQQHQQSAQAPLPAATPSMGFPCPFVDAPAPPLASAPNEQRRVTTSPSTVADRAGDDTPTAPASTNNEISAAATAENAGRPAVSSFGDASSPLDLQLPKTSSDAKAHIVEGQAEHQQIPMEQWTPATIGANPSPLEAAAAVPASANQPMCSVPAPLNDVVLSDSTAPNAIAVAAGNGNDKSIASASSRFLALESTGTITSPGPATVNSAAVAATAPMAALPPPAAVRASAPDGGSSKPVLTDLFGGSFTDPQSLPATRTQLQQQPPLHHGSASASSQSQAQPLSVPAMQFGAHHSLAESPPPPSFGLGHSSASASASPAGFQLSAGGSRSAQSPSRFTPHVSPSAFAGAPALATPAGFGEGAAIPPPFVPWTSGFQMPTPSGQSTSGAAASSGVAAYVGTPLSVRSAMPAHAESALSASCEGQQGTPLVHHHQNQNQHDPQQSQYEQFAPARRCLPLQEHAAQSVASSRSLTPQLPTPEWPYGTPPHGTPTKQSRYRTFHSDVSVPAPALGSDTYALAQLPVSHSRSTTPQLPPPEIGFRLYGVGARSCASAELDRHGHSMTGGSQSTGSFARHGGASIGAFHSNGESGGLGVGATTAGSSGGGGGSGAPESGSPTVDASPRSAEGGKRGYTKVFVCGLPPGDEAMLYRFLNTVFEPYGVREIKLRLQRQQWSAFVWCGSKDKAAAAVAALNMSEFAAADGTTTALGVEPAHSSFGK